MNIWKTLQRNRIERIKEQTKGVDALPMLRFLLENAKTFTDEERKGLDKSIQAGFQSSGEMLLERSFLEKDLTKEEWKDLQKKGFDTGEISPILQGYFGRKDGCTKKREKIICLTMPETNIYKHRKFIEERFGVIAMTIDEAILNMYKHDKKMKAMVEKKPEMKAHIMKLLNEDSHNG